MDGQPAYHLGSVNYIYDKKNDHDQYWIYWESPVYEATCPAPLPYSKSLTLSGALIGVYFKLQTEIGKLKGRIAMLEKQELQVMSMLEKLVVSVDELKLLLAQQGIK